MQSRECHYFIAKHKFSHLSSFCFGDCWQTKLSERLSGVGIIKGTEYRHRLEWFSSAEKMSLCKLNVYYRQKSRIDREKRSKEQCISNPMRYQVKSSRSNTDIFLYFNRNDMYSFHVKSGQETLWQGSLYSYCYLTATFTYRGA